MPRASPHPSDRTIALQRALVASIHSGRDEQRVLTRPQAGLEARLSIYARNTVGARAKALLAAYPACARVVGESCFRALARDYVCAHASKAPDLNQYGAEFCDFLQPLTDAGAPLHALPYLADLARLEWAWQRALYAPLPAPFPAQAFAEAVVAGERLTLSVAPGLSLLRSPWPVVEIRALNLTHGSARQVRGLKAPACWCIHGTALGPRSARIEPPTAALLDACLHTIAFEQMPQRFGGAPGQWLSCLTNAVARGWINGFRVARRGGAC